MRNILLSLALLVSGLVSGCATQPTQVIVTIDAEPGVIAEGARLRLSVFGGVSGTTAMRFERVLVPGVQDAPYPFELALAPLDGDVGRTYGVTATAETAVGGFVGQARVIGSYVQGETLFVRLTLEDTCQGVVCSAEETCKAGACVDARTGVQSWGDAGPEEDLGRVDGGVDAGGDAGQDSGVDSGADAETDAGTDSGVDSGTDAGTCGGFQSGTWLRTYVCTSGSCAPASPITAYAGSFIELTACPSFATDCLRLTGTETSCTTSLTYDYDVSTTVEKSAILGETGALATGIIIYHYSRGTVSQYRIDYVRTGP